MGKQKRHNNFLSTVSKHWYILCLCWQIVHIQIEWLLCACYDGVKNSETKLSCLDHLKTFFMYQFPQAPDNPFPTIAIFFSKIHSWRLIFGAEIIVRIYEEIVFRIKLTSRTDSSVVKTMKQVLLFSCDGVVFNWPKYIFQPSTVFQRVQWAWFWSCICFILNMYCI